MTLNTVATFYNEPRNIDYLIPSVRVRLGDLTGESYSDTLVRTAIIYGIQYLQNRWTAKYQIYDSAILVSPQPEDAPSGYVYANTVNGTSYIPSGLQKGDVFRNPYVEFEVIAPPVITQLDEEAIVLAAKYIIRASRITSSIGSFTSWRTEDLSYTNLGAEKTLNNLLANDIQELNDYFKYKLGKPVSVLFAPVY